MSRISEEKHSLTSLWRQFLPLSLSDVTMAFADPAITTTLAHLPSARTNLAAVGVAKSLAIFFESPIIMILHASNTLGARRSSREALKRFTLLAMAALTGVMLVISIPPVFAFVAGRLLGVPGEVALRAGRVLMALSLWPAAIAWRRYYQGLLIRHGRGGSVARAGVGRLVVVALLLAVGFAAGWDGALLGAVALVGGVIAEAAFVTWAARLSGVEHAPELNTAGPAPSGLRAVWRFYWPLANSMLVVWGGRAVLVAVIARAVDGSLALAAWPAAWGLILLIGNSTRMVQQVIIRNHESASHRLLLKFGLSVGAAASLILLLLSATPWGHAGVRAFLGGDPALFGAVLPVLTASALIPLAIAVQNAAQGFLMARAATSRINAATWIGTTLLLAVSSLLVSRGVPGATAAAAAMFVALVGEIAWLGLALLRREVTPSGGAGATRR